MFRPSGCQRVQIGGENYGWRLKEGRVCFKPPSGGDPGGLRDPVHGYDHGAGGSGTGGVVYRGGDVPALHGVCLYADYGRAGRSCICRCCAADQGPTESGRACER